MPVHIFALGREGRIDLGRMHRLTTALVLGAALALAGGCGVRAVNTTTSDPLKVDVKVIDSLTRYEIAYVLQPGDHLEVFVYRHPDFSRKAAIRPDGVISLPLVGEVKASGLTPGELSKRLTELFSVRLKNPEVTVMVENPPDPMVYVVGEVGVPKAIPLRQAKTAAQAIAQSGAVVRGADLSEVAVIRLNKDGQLEARTVLGEDPTSQPGMYMALNALSLMPNDLVLVPEGYRGQIVRLVADINTLMTPYFQYRVLTTIGNP